MEGLYIFLVYAVYNSEVRNAIKRIKEKRKALSFMVSCAHTASTWYKGSISRTTERLMVPFQNCSQPTSFLPSQRAPMTSWVSTPPNLSSPETSETSGTPSSRSLVIRNGKGIRKGCGREPVPAAERTQMAPSRL
ncbi:unnamed protein product [Tetraodon nigroviridis]|uniref:(spotted green pufferfish) hypothetical protein n=1 Tax=Tetraodon nigroviridis TaxID=99883 RepID=Q4SDH7_TETNG|nr:unnamed protein product [Tetraodon nigroviridis]